MWSADLCTSSSSANLCTSASSPGFSTSAGSAGFSTSASSSAALLVSGYDDVYRCHAADDVFAEFHRITNVNLRNQFYCELDRYTPKLVALYGQKSSRTGKRAEALQEMLRIYDLEEEHDINMRHTLVLHGLPVYLQEDDTEFYKTCNGEDEMETTDTPLALLSVAPDSTGSSSFSPENISIVIEDKVVMSELPRLADAFVVLLGLLYALHLDYPKKLTHTFTFIQKVRLCLDDNKALKPCLLYQKNELLKE
ncbi:uncharacterized protein LOC133649501 [Entelurus aequoreus]|uniref:uncharacterized protein LOC133649501 n=1 Tax=Entelurus aequoreus TaxID=161455 RepID=UPI002B1D8A0D|nr:uncharacterized protein LOC133649501 [Entelurus aequoreus]